MTTELNVTETSGAAAAVQPLTIVNGTLVVPVKDGRRLTLTYPDPLAQYKIVRAMGPMDADNTRLCLMYMPLIYLTAIDETPVLLPTSLLQIEALIGRLGHKGLAALKAGIKVFDAADEEAVDEAKK
jgi:hypothetical protein